MKTKSKTTEKRKVASQRPRAAVDLGSKSSALLEYLQPRKAEMIALIQKLVEQESPSLKKAPVDVLGETLTAIFRNVGARVTTHWREDYGDHVQADFAGRSGSPVLLLGHFD